MSITLTPPDLNRCQAEKPNGNTFMTCGGLPAMERCDAKPAVIVTEAKPGADGLCGSMSLCNDCWKVLLRQCGPDFAYARPIEAP